MRALCSKLLAGAGPTPICQLSQTQSRQTQFRCRLAWLLAAAAASLLPLAAATAARCQPGHAPGHWGGARVVDGEEQYIWVRDGDAADCAWEVESRDDLLRVLRGRHVAFVGDSTTRQMFYELLLWGWGCLPADTEAAYATVGHRFVDYRLEKPGWWRTADNMSSLCHIVATSQRRDRTPQSLIIPVSPVVSMNDIRVSFRWVTFAWTLRDELVWTLTPGRLPGGVPDIVFVNAGFWHLRAAPNVTPYGLDDDFGIGASMDAVITALDALPPSGMPVRSRVVWRGYNHITMTDGRFSNAVIDRMDARMLDKWGTSASFPTVSVAQYVPPSDGEPSGDPQCIFTEEGYHPRRWVYREMLKEVLQTGLDVLASTGIASSSVSPYLASSSTLSVSPSISPAYATQGSASSAAFTAAMVVTSSPTELVFRQPSAPQPTEMVDSENDRYRGSAGTVLSLSPTQRHSGIVTSIVGFYCTMFSVGLLLFLHRRRAQGTEH